MINNHRQPHRPKPLGRRLAVAGVLTAAVLAGGAGFAYASTAAGTPPAESGYATVVEEGNPDPERLSRSDCPERGAGSAAPADGSEQTPEQTPSRPRSRRPSRPRPPRATLTMT